MQEFDPRQLASRKIALTPKLLAGAAGVVVVAFGCKLALANGRIDPPLPDTASVQHLASEAFTQAEAQPGFSRPQNVALKIKPGETFEAAVQRAGVTAQEAHEAVATLGEAMDTVHIKAGMPFDAAIAQPQGEHGPARLIGLSLRSGPASAITLSRTFDGALRLREMQEKVNDEQTVAKGEIDGSLYESAARLGATPTVTAQVAKMFAHKLDFQRDIQPGDKFTLIFDRKVTESGRTIQSGDVEYAQIKGVKFYRFERRDGDVEYFDENGKNVRGFLLRTPVDGARMTSTFGMRKHPILGYTRMHKGIDFGAGMGTPVVAAGDGVVVEARRWGTYGNWVRIRHTGGWDTGYAHLSRFAKGLHAGDRVRQGQVIAYVGSTGASTGPHLHYEIWKNGQRVNPIGAKVPQGTVLAGAELAKFRTVKAHIDHLVETKGDDQNGETALAMAETSDSVGLRR